MPAHKFLLFSVFAELIFFTFQAVKRQIGCDKLITPEFIIGKTKKMQILTTVLIYRPKVEGYKKNIHTASQSEN